MSCHLCENSAIGLCRQCFKFYCHEHGNGYCSSCQQKGWEEESGTRGWSFAYSKHPTEPSGIPLAALAGSSETTQAEETEKAEETEPSEQEQVQEIEATGSGMEWIDQEKVEELTEPARFVSLLPVFGSAQANNALLMIKGIELYQQAFNIDPIMHFGSNIDNGTQYTGT